jgi:hypothetical protein
MQLKIHLSLILAIVLTLFVALLAYTDRTLVLPWFEVVLTWTPRALGLLIATVAAFALLHRSLSGETLDGHLPFVFPLFAGLLLVHFDGIVALALAAVCVAVIVKQFLGRSTTPTTHDGGTS